jgi:hypothetical protein
MFGFVVTESSHFPGKLTGVENLKGRHHLGDLRKHERIILEKVLKI